MPPRQYAAGLYFLVLVDERLESGPVVSEGRIRLDVKG